MPKIKFLKIREVKSPNRANKEDAGIDFFVPMFTPDFLNDLIDKNEELFHVQNGLVINSGPTTTIDLSGGASTPSDHPQFGFNVDKGAYFRLPGKSRVLIPSGIKSRMEKPGRALIAANKSGVATKHGLVFGAQVVDYTYKGEIHLSLINTSNESVNIYQGQKILQFLEAPVFTSEVLVVDATDDDARETVEKNFYDGLEDDRGAGGFGSTGE